MPAAGRNPTPAPTSTTVYNAGTPLANPSNSSGYQSTSQPSAKPTQNADGSTSTTATTESTQEIVVSELDQAGPDPQFTASKSSDATCAPGSTGNVPTWDTTVHNNASHTEGNLDLTGFTRLAYEYGELRGTIEMTDAETGNAHTTDYTEDVSARLGTKSFYRVYAAQPAKYYHDSGGGYNAAQGYAKITINSLYLIPRKSDDD